MRFVTSLEVQFGPHIGDWLTLGAMVISAAMSFFVAMAALKSGKEATRLAAESNQREKTHRSQERRRANDLTRRSAAAAMMHSFWSLEMALRIEQNSPDTTDIDSARIEANVLKRNALVEIEMLPRHENPVSVATWFEETWLKMLEQGQSVVTNTDVQNQLRADATSTVRDWRYLKLSSRDLEAQVEQP